MNIDVRHITKAFNSFSALRDVSLTITEGELVGLLGPSGSGKTTLLRIIAGLEFPEPAPDAGVFFDGRDVSQRAVGGRHVGFVFQHYALFRHMTVADNIAFGLRVWPRVIRPSEREIQDRVRQLLALIQLEGMERRYPSQLSGGQRQRVALARALAVEPRVLLLDEPFGALDAKVRLELRRWLRRLHDDIGLTSVFVTHDQEEALELADRVVVMNQGQIEQVGTPDELFHQPATPFVMEFLGQVNLFHGRVERGRAVFGPLVVEHAGAPNEEGAPARLFVRSHEFDVMTERPEDAVFQARVVRVWSAGPTIKLELALAGGQSVFVEQPHGRGNGTAPLERGAEVFVRPRKARVFVEDDHEAQQRRGLLPAT